MLFKTDRDLISQLRDIRESVRVLFEQLRLRNENGDVSGKERLERVPALAKRNFGNLTGDHIGRAIAEAWRLIDFLEGAKAGQLTPLAREALRPIELDTQLTKLRASESWRQAALLLRTALDPSPTPTTTRENAGADPDLRATDPPEPRLAAQSRSTSSSKVRRLRPALFGLLALAGLASLAAFWPREDLRDPRTACLPLERASADDLAAHRTIASRSVQALPEPDPSRPDPVLITLDDPPEGPVQSIWTTSQFSFDPGRPEHGSRGPGGGQANEYLRVGGWGDTYLSLIKVPVPNSRPARRAILRLAEAPEFDPASRPTSMVLRMVVDPWDVPAGPQHRLWWRDCPRSAALMRLPQPSRNYAYYGIDITELYNLWASGEADNHGLMLEPEQIGSYGDSAEGYSHFNTFHSTRAADPEKRPTLILSY